MKKFIRILICLFLFSSAFYLKGVWQDKEALQENLIRLHVVANSDLKKDQDVKLQVKDAVVDYLQPVLANFTNKDQAMAYVNDNLSAIEAVANEILADMGEELHAVVSLGKENFNTRRYDTFSLPAGIYDSLRIKIGEGQGKNWWCVVFPTLCLPATSENFCDTAVSSGFSETLGNSLVSGRNLRFYILDYFGKLENLFY